MAKKVSLSTLRSKEWTLSSKIRTKTDEYTRRKAALMAERDKLDALRETIQDMKDEHNEIREEIREIEGY